MDPSFRCYRPLLVAQADATPLPERTRGMTASEREACRHLFEAGWGAVALAELYHTDPDAIRALVRAPRHRRHIYPRMSREAQALLLTMAGSGMDKHELMTRFGISSATAGKAIRAARKEKEQDRGEEN